MMLKRKKKLHEEIQEVPLPNVAMMLAAMLFKIKHVHAVCGLKFLVIS